MENIHITIFITIFIHNYTQYIIHNLYTVIYSVLQDIGYQFYWILVEGAKDTVLDTINSTELNCNVMLKLEHVVDLISYTCMDDYENNENYTISGQGNVVSRK